MDIVEFSLEFLLCALCMAAVFLVSALAIFVVRWAIKFISDTDRGD